MANQSDYESDSVHSLIHSNGCFYYKKKKKGVAQKRATGPRFGCVRLTFFLFIFYISFLFELFLIFLLFNICCSKLFYFVINIIVI